MTPPLSDAEASAVRQAAEQFTRALASETILDATAHIEAMLHASGPAPVFLLDQALAAAWPEAAGIPPRREVIWASEAVGSREGLVLSALDASGRVLLRRSYAGPGARPDGEKPRDA